MRWPWQPRRVRLRYDTGQGTQRTTLRPGDTLAITYDADLRWLDGSHHTFRRTIEVHVEKA